MKAQLIAIAFAAVKADSRLKPGAPHWNEDPRSRPEYTSGNKYLTSTQARYISEEYTGHEKAAEPKGTEAYWLRPYNAQDKEYTYVGADSSSSSSSSSDSDDDAENVQLSWRQTPDLGELDDHVMLREHDIANGKKASGWTNPLGWSDTGDDDDQVVTQLHADIRYAVSEGPTKVDLGEAD